MMHFLLPIPNKRDSDWSYSWVPILEPPWVQHAQLQCFLFWRIKKIPYLIKFFKKIKQNSKKIVIF